MLHMLERKSLLAGMLIGLVVLVNLSLDNKYIGAMLFSLGIAFICEKGLYLYTGRIGNLNCKFLEYASMIIWNLLGCNLIVSLGGIINPKLSDKILFIGNTKFTKSYLVLFSLGLFCGMCVEISVRTKNIVITVFAIMAFVLSGFEHCVADIPYLVFNIISNKFDIFIILKYIMIILGNSIGAIIVNKLQIPSKN